MFHGLWFVAIPEGLDKSTRLSYGGLEGKVYFNFHLSM